MSWSANYSDVGGRLDELDANAISPPDPSDDVRAQFEAAKLAAHDLINSRALGFGKRYNVGLSGHANPGHEPAAGWANDCITVSISQRGE